MTPHWVGWVGTALTMIAFLPQIRVLRKSRRAGALSVKSNAINLTACASLLAYAVLRDDLIFVIIMGFQLASTLVILALNIRYEDPAP